MEALPWFDTFLRGFRCIQAEDPLLSILVPDVLGKDSTRVSGAGYQSISNMDLNVQSLEDASRRQQSSGSLSDLLTLR